MMEEARAGGPLVRKGDLRGNVLRIAPPLPLSEADEELDALSEAVAITAALF